MANEVPHMQPASVPTLNRLEQLCVLCADENSTTCSRNSIHRPHLHCCVELKSRPSGNMRQRVWNGVRLALTHRSTGETTLIGW